MSVAAPSSRLAELQVLRGIAAFLVVIVHAINVSDYRMGMGIDDRPAWLAVAYAFNEAGAMGVDLFFVISGFVMAMMLARTGTGSDGPAVGQFLRDRFVRVVPLYWLASIVFALTALLAGRAVEPGAYLASLLVVPTSINHYVTPTLAVGWSLAFELTFYAVVAGAFALPRQQRTPAVALIMTTAGVIGTIWNVPSGLFAVFANPIVLEFVLGIGVYHAWIWGRAKQLSPAMATLMAVIGAQMLLVTAFFGYGFATPHGPVIAGESGLQRAWVWGVPWALVVLGLCLRAPMAGRAPGFLHHLGDASYSLYLVHPLVCLAAEAWLPSAIVDPDIMVVSVIVASVALGFAAHRWVERPMLSALRQSARVRPAIA